MVTSVSVPSPQGVIEPSGSLQYRADDLMRELDKRQPRPQPTNALASVAESAYTGEVKATVPVTLPAGMTGAEFQAKFTEAGESVAGAFAS